MTTNTKDTENYMFAVPKDMYDEMQRRKTEFGETLRYQVVTAWREKYGKKTEVKGHDTEKDAGSNDAGGANGLRGETA